MKIKNLFMLGVALLMLYACQQKSPLEAKRKELKEKKKELREVKTKIDELEKEISAIDPEFAKSNRKATLISTLKAEKADFAHYLEISGAVKSRKNVLISAENMGNVQHIYFKEGAEVKKGQLVITLDAVLYKRTLDQLKTEYALANTMYEKQSNLWKQNIGTEIQYLEAKNRKESLENQIANVKTQISKSNVRAPFAGTIEEVFVKEGEMAQMGSPMVRIVNHKDTYVKAELSESYINRFKKGAPVEIEFPSLDQKINSRINSVGQVINEMNRTFSIEAYLPKTKFAVKPNLLAILKLKDFEQRNAVVIPSKLIQRDNQGEFVFVVKEKDNEQLSQKVHIKRGRTYKSKTMIISGLQGDELLVNEGFRDVVNGSSVKIVENVI